MAHQRQISFGTDVEVVQSHEVERAAWPEDAAALMAQLDPEAILAADRRIYHCDYSGAHDALLVSASRLRTYINNRLIQVRSESKVKNKISVENFLKFEPRTSGGTHIFLLPSVEHALSSKAEHDPALQHHLVNRFHVPSFFFERMGWDANGFHLVTPNPVPDFTGTSRAHTMRFLAKEVAFSSEWNPQDELISYRWRFMAFHLLRLKPRGGSRGSLILLCFDLLEPQLQPEKDRLVSSFEECFDKNIAIPSNEDEYELLGNLLEHVVSRYDAALWTYRKPVRAMEKANDKFIAHLWRAPTSASLSAAHAAEGHNRFKSADATGSAIEKGLPDESATFRPRSRAMSLDEMDIEKHRRRLSIETGRSEARYRYIHDLTRHVVHIVECLAVGANTLNNMADDFETEATGLGNGLKRYGGRLTFLRMTLTNLQHRAKAFEARLQNESRMASHIAEEKAAQTSRQILEQSRQLLHRASDDGRELTHFVSGLSILFLPPTFTSGFFGMQFFSLPVQYIWIYFVVTIPLLIMAAWAWQNVNRLTLWAKKLKAAVKRRFQKRKQHFPRDRK